jgi:hypothetical protein
MSSPTEETVVAKITPCFENGKASLDVLPGAGLDDDRATMSIGYATHREKRGHILVCGIVSWVYFTQIQQTGPSP